MDCLRNLISTLDIVSNVGFKELQIQTPTGMLCHSFLFFLLCSICTIALIY